MNKSSPLVSIGMPTFNHSQYITQSIDSLLAQKYRNFELIISDNASTDNTENICRSYAEKDKRIRYIRQIKNIGAINNFNFVLTKAKGRYFMWAADDDLWDKNYIMAVIKQILITPEAVLGITAYKLFNNRINKSIIPVQADVSTRLKSLVFYLNNSYEIGMFFYGIYDAAVLKKIGGLHVDNRPFSNPSSDILTVLKVLLRGKLIYINKPLYHKRDTGYFLTIFDDLGKKKELKNLRKYFTRYISYYIYNYIDLFLFLRYTYSSKLIITDKFIISWFSLRNFGKANILFIKTIAMGVYRLATNRFYIR